MRFSILALLCMTPSAALADATSGLISLDDYPKDAMRRGEQGTVVAELAISPEGRVTGCKIVKSATPSLDKATCSVLTRRARFKPAMDEQGRTVADTYTATITWKLGDYQWKENKNNNSTRMQN